MKLLKELNEGESWLRRLANILSRPVGATKLYQRADAVRRQHTGEEVHVRGIIEFSNRCSRNCHYCGIRRANRAQKRYCMSPDEIVASASRAAEFGYGTVVLQSGEPAPYEIDELCAIVRRIKDETDLAVTLSCGVYSPAEYERLARAGCDRYLLRFETSNPELYEKLHPDSSLERRLRALEHIRGAGMQTGSGFMIGLPGGGLEDLARDVLLTSRLKLDMIGCGPFLRSPETPLAEGERALLHEELYFKVMALLRLLNPFAHIPATTAFDTLAEQGRDLVLRRGGNVFMPNLTPGRYRKQYQLYPDKPCVDEHADRCAGCVKARLKSLGRPLATGPGHSLIPG